VWIDDDISVVEETADGLLQLTLVTSLRNFPCHAVSKFAMKRFIKAMPLIIVTFIVGVAVTLAWAHLYPRRVSLCEIARNPASYSDKLVRIEATASAVSSRYGDESFIIIGETGCVDGGAVSSVYLDPDVELSRDADEFVNSPTLEIRDAQIVVKGVFHEWATMSCFAPRFGIKMQL
jgi:hypothetical protein